ncbi:NAD(P)-dependent dehydrogenase (short-subunit alcohol dehydrogenase family) [Duganella sp. 1224]|uniref:SDR family NAD(P)-dependent oxidoreductase n=1 Tax=Duganella sp. 1224 TaxID=2587052 RepID=UPI0015CE19B1|nr:SDR family oxidoreductase [Duganella sp. 1224]NYE63928.1 NAD(P)-dependent dehydrogenase (short-subunit alcohol dehydrogenase family) [Duganella sp. 1224]
MSAAQKVAIVTGASQGIGAAIVKAYRQLGYRVVATSRTIKPSDDPDVATVAGDIGDRATAQRVVAEALARFGRVDSLVNNAGIYIGKPFTENTIDDYNAIMNVNMAGFFHITQLALTEMEKQAAGHVVTVTGSIDNGMSGGVYTGLAGLTKGGLNAATRALAIEYADRRIRVNAVAPGVIKTPMHAEENLKFFGQYHPLGRIGEASEVASAITFLETAEFITGEIIHVDGGQHAGR